MSNIIEVKNLCKSYKDKHVISNLSFVIENGDFLMVIGESGIGKSTFLNIISLIDKPNSGELIIDNEPIDFNNI